MAKLTENTSIQRLQNKYRLVIMNDDTFEEVVTFKLSRISVYIALSSIFVLLVSLTICLLVFTPLKYSIPGYGNRKSVTQLQLLKYRTDSLDQAIKYREEYLDGLKMALIGEKTINLDTINLKINKFDEHDDREFTNETKRKKRRRN